MPEGMMLIWHCKSKRVASSSMEWNL